MSDPQI